MTKKEESYKILQGDCLEHLRDGAIKDIHLTFFDPPYNQGKDYDYFDDEQDPERYWSWMKEIVTEIYKATAKGGALYLMHREKNSEFLLNILREAGWIYQNLIIWKKMTSAVPGRMRYGKQFQVLAFVTKGKKPRVFNRLRIDPPLPPHYKHQRENGMFVTDIWADIRELTAGYFAGDEALRDKEGERVHKQQTPVALLLRIILSSSKAGDLIFDPMAGTGTTLVTASQIKRSPIGIEIDPKYVKLIKKRLKTIRPSDDVSQFYKDYEFTPDLEEIWAVPVESGQQRLT